MKLKTRNLLFFGLCALSILANVGLFRHLLAFSLSHEFASHVLLIPLASIALVLRRRKTIFSRAGSSYLAGAIVAIAGLAILVYGRLAGSGPGNEQMLSVSVLPDGHFKIPHLWPGQNPPPPKQLRLFGRSIRP